MASQPAEILTQTEEQTASMHQTQTLHEDVDNKTNTTQKNTTDKLQADVPNNGAGVHVQTDEDTALLTQKDHVVERFNEDVILFNKTETLSEQNKNIAMETGDIYVAGVKNNNENVKNTDVLGADLAEPDVKELVLLESNKERNTLKHPEGIKVLKEENDQDVRAHTDEERAQLARLEEHSDGDLDVLENIAEERGSLTESNEESIASEFEEKKRVWSLELQGKSASGSMKNEVVLTPSSPTTKAMVLSSLIQDKTIVSTPTKSRIAVLQRGRSEMNLATNKTSKILSKTMTQQSLTKSGIPIMEKSPKQSTPNPQSALIKRNSEQSLVRNVVRKSMPMLRKRSSEPLLLSSGSTRSTSPTSSVTSLDRKAPVPSRYYRPKRSVSFIQRTPPPESESRRTGSLQALRDDREYEEEATGMSLVLAMPVDGDPQSLAMAAAESTRSFEIAPYGQTYTLKARCGSSGIYRYMKLIV